MKPSWILSVAALTAASGLLAQPVLAAAKPNIVIIYGDDVGFGDLGCYGATEVKTPNTDRLAAEGLRFTNAHAAAATCTPSRFSILTGEYAFRQKGTRILRGDATLIIRPGRETLPAMLQRAGYVTAAIGKWHLGLGSPGQEVDWNGDIKPGPLEVGFNESFLIPATPDRVPCVYVRNHRVVGLDPHDPIRVSYQHPLPGEVTYRQDPGLATMASTHGHDGTVINGIGRIGHMTGGRSALWKDEEMEEVLARQAVEFIQREKDRPFFLYYASHDIHVPRVPNPRFVGRTTMGPRGDEIAEFDWAVGQIVGALERLHLLDHTLIILSSDNGPVLDDGYADQANERLGSHRPAGPLRAGKYSGFEGGTRVPFISFWPDRIKPGVSDALLSQVDLLASLASLTGTSFNAREAVDSENLSAALLGQSRTGRTALVEDAGELALREGDWKYLPPGLTRDLLGPWKYIRIPSPGLLFNLADDPGETKNLAPSHPAETQHLNDRLETLRSGEKPPAK